MDKENERLTQPPPHSVQSNVIVLVTILYDQIAKEYAHIYNFTDNGPIFQFKNKVLFREVFSSRVDNVKHEGLSVQ